MIYYIEYYSNDGGGTTYRIGSFYSTREKAEIALQKSVNNDPWFADMYYENNIWIAEAPLV